MTLALAIATLCKTDVVIDSTLFNNQLATIQTIIGQTDGGFAGHFFSDHDDWNTYDFEVKQAILLQYVAYEIESITNAILEL